jgi:hypothetical protein
MRMRRGLLRRLFLVLAVLFLVLFVPLFLLLLLTLVLVLLVFLFQGVLQVGHSTQPTQKYPSSQQTPSETHQHSDQTLSSQVDLSFV